MARNVLTFILAGGKGERLNPLTRDRAKPAVPFGGIYRIIDFTLSNCINSGLRRIFVLIQYKSFSLQKHILAGWDVVSSQLGEFIDPIPAQQRMGEDWYKGTADAIYQNIYAMHDHGADLILILAGDHLYKMNYQKMIDAHVANKADVSVACIKMPKEDSVHFGVIVTDKDNFISGFQEKPQDPKTIPGDPKHIYASMGIYLFSAKVLVKELERDAEDVRSGHDFGKNVIPDMVASKKKVLAYDFGQQSSYWRDIGTRDAYYEAHMDLVRPNPSFDLYDKAWPLRSHHAHYPPVSMRTLHENGVEIPGIVIDSIVSPGCIIAGGRVERSVLSAQVSIRKGALVQDSVVMEGVVVGEGALIKNAIIDKQVAIPAGEKIGYDLDLDRTRFAVTASGIVIVAKKTAIPELS
ncbi:MAG: glucose-1-phosphate adenylyltransferase [Candidatus Omnitrophica bacterium]|nr:glucose-1-phosphate adenylyltransferase [Candidatus Omnitrophota bacterium]